MVWIPKWYCSNKHFVSKSEWMFSFRLEWQWHYSFGIQPQWDRFIPHVEIEQAIFARCFPLEEIFLMHAVGYGIEAASNFHSTWLHIQAKSGKISHFQLYILNRRSFPSLRKPHFMNKLNKYNFNHKNVTDNCRVAFNCAHTFTFSDENSHICYV